MLAKVLFAAALLLAIGSVSSRRRHTMAASSSHKQTRGAALDKAFGDVVTFTPTGDHLGTVIFMHGLGVSLAKRQRNTAAFTPCCPPQDSCDGWTDVVESVFAPALPHIKFIVPTSTTLPVSKKLKWHLLHHHNTHPPPAGHHQRRHANAGMV